jgi:hypothetical protein
LFYLSKISKEERIERASAKRGPKASSRGGTKRIQAWKHSSLSTKHTLMSIIFKPIFLLG